jgi:hypothetical protein
MLSPYGDDDDDLELNAFIDRLMTVTCQLVLIAILTSQLAAEQFVKELTSRKRIIMISVNNVQFTT